MGWASHPARDNLFGRCLASSDIFGKVRRPAVAGRQGAADERRSVWPLVAEEALIGHLGCIGACSTGQRGGDRQGRKARAGALSIHQVSHPLGWRLGDRGNDRPMGGSKNKECKHQPSKHNTDLPGT